VKKDKSAYSVQSIEYALDVLEQFLDKNDELGVTEVSRRLGLSKNHAFRILATLVSRNYLEQNGHTDGYRLGLKNVALGQTAMQRMSLLLHARPVLEALTRACNETSDLAIMKGARVFYLNAVETALPVRAVPRTGSNYPAYCTAAGKVLLAGTTGREELQQLNAGDLRQYTPNTITARLELQAQMEKIAAQEYALEDEELEKDVRGVAAPIRDYTRCAIGAVSVCGPVVRFGTERIHDELLPMVKRAAEEISMRLGYSSSMISRRLPNRT
jgi:DNA-binding IclR family transcriptional regulator